MFWLIWPSECRILKISTMTKYHKNLLRDSPLSFLSGAIFSSLETKTFLNHPKNHPTSTNGLLRTATVLITVLYRTMKIVRYMWNADTQNSDIWATLWWKSLTEFLLDLILMFSFEGFEKPWKACFSLCFALCFSLFELDIFLCAWRNQNKLSSIVRVMNRR